MRADALEANLGSAAQAGKPVIHDVDILDASGSMSGSKYQNSILSIQKGVELLGTDTAVQYLKTTVEFSSYGITRHSMAVPLTDANFRPVGAGGMTPLYDTVGIILTQLREIVKDDERVLVKIFTDGQDTGYRTWTPHTLKVLIDQLKGKGWTITFNGTDQDIDSVVKNLNIDRSNTLAHDNTGEGIMKMAMTRGRATMLYSKSVAAGVSADQLVSNFYTKTVNETEK